VTVETLGGLVANPRLIHRPRIRIVAAHGGVVAVGVLGAIPRRIIAGVTVTETITKVVTKKSATDSEYGAAPESTEPPIEVPT
jgi:hypothetical protein